MGKVNQPIVYVAIFSAATLGATPTSLPSAAQPLHSGPYTCKPGLVWREAVTGDLVCVLPARRDAVRADNSQAGARRQPGGGPFGPDTCRAPFVWREAWPSDHVCVSGAERDRIRNENASAVHGLASPASVPLGSVSTRDVRRDTNSRDLEASGHGFTPRGQVSFYGVNPSWTGPRTLGFTTADAQGNVGPNRAWAYLRTVDITTTHCRQHPNGIVVVGDARTGRVVRAGEQRYVCM